MLTIYEGTAVDYTAYVIDANNLPIDMSTATSIFLTLTHTVSGATIGPISGAATATLGQLVFPLSVSNTSDSGLYNAVINYNIGGVSETTFSRPVEIIKHPRLYNVSVISGQASTINLTLTDVSGAPINLTGKTVVCNSQINHSTAPIVVIPHTVVDAISGKVSITVTTAVKLFCHFTINANLTNEFIITPVVN